MGSILLYICQYFVYLFYLPIGGCWGNSQLLAITILCLCFSIKTPEGNSFSSDFSSFQSHLLTVLATWVLYRRTSRYCSLCWADSPRRLALPEAPSCTCISLLGWAVQTPQWPIYLFLSHLTSLSPVLSLLPALFVFLSSYFLVVTAIHGAVYCKINLGIVS